MNPMTQHPVILIDSREPWPHPWAAHWPSDIEVRREALPTGDVCLAGNPLVAVERKAPADLVACMTSERQRFERELRRASSELDRMTVIVEGSMDAVLLHRRGMSSASVLGTLATWARRYRHPFLFAPTVEVAAELCLRFLTGPVREAERVLRSTRRAGKEEATA